MHKYSVGETLESFRKGKQDWLGLATVHLPLSLPAHTVLLPKSALRPQHPDEARE
jgi:hypothetical protein